MLRIRCFDVFGSLLRAGPMTAACALALGCASALAQTTPEFPNPLAPKLQTDPRTPPRFQKFGPQEQVQLGPPATFNATPSAAGNTGFDSTNSRKTRARSQPRARTQASPAATADTAPPPPPVSPYQKPFGDSASKANVSAPGTPPVEIGPIRKPLKRKPVGEEDDPYAALGFHAGSFLLYPAVDLIGGYTTNPAQTAVAKGASLYTVAPELRAQSNWSRHELKADLRGSYTGYSPDSEPTLSRPNANGRVDGRIDVTSTTRVDLNGRVLVATDNPNSPNLQAGLAELPIYTTYGGSVGVGQKFNRVDISLKGDIERTAYRDSKLTDGTTASNADRNYDQVGLVLRGGYELSPGVTPFVEGRVDNRKHDLNTDSSGYQRDSKGMTVQVGSTFELSRLLTGEAAVGYTTRDYEDPRLEKLSGFLGNASLIWSVNGLTTAKFTAASGIAESTIAGISGVFTRDFGVQVDHAFRRWLVGSAKFGFGMDSYEGTDAAGAVASREDKRYSAGLGLTYKLNRMAQLKGEFRQDWLRSNVTGNDYTASTFLLGLRLQQ